MQRRAAGRSVAVTGVGAVCGLGWGVAALWEGLRAGRSGIGPFRPFRPLPAPHPPGRRGRRSAAGPGPRRPGLAPPVDRRPLRPVCRPRGGGAGRPGDGPLEEEGGRGSTSAAARAACTRASCSSPISCATAAGAPLRPGRAAGQRPGDAVARHLGVTGPVATFSSACASGALALGVALEAVRSGEVEVAIAGGSDSLCQLTYAGFNALRSVDEVPCRPFRADRAGMSFGEGAAVLVLEPLERALARGAEPLAVLAGAGASCDAHHMTAPDPSGAGAAAALAAALADAGPAAGGGRLRQRPRHGHAAQRRRRVAGAAAGLRRAGRGDAAGGHQGADRPPAGLLRRASRRWPRCSACGTASCTRCGGWGGGPELPVCPGARRRPSPCRARGRRSPPAWPSVAPTPRSSSRGGRAGPLERARPAHRPREPWGPGAAARDASRRGPGRGDPAHRRGRPLGRLPPPRTSAAPRLPGAAGRSSAAGSRRRSPAA